MGGAGLKVFLSGSLAIRSLPSQVVDDLNRYTTQGVTLLVGDAPGADALFQHHLVGASYADVEVFHSGHAPRFNLGDWSTYFVDSGLASRGKALHGAKDREMSEQCDHGLMVWDGKSAGTIANVLHLIRLGKAWRLYWVREHVAETISDGEMLTSRFSAVVDEATKRLAAHARRLEKRRKELVALDSPFLI